MKYIIKISLNRSSRLQICKIDPNTKEVLSCQEKGKGDFLNYFLSKIHDGKFIREFCFISSKTLYISFAKSTISSFEEIDSYCTFEMDDDELFMKKLRMIEREFQSNRDSIQQKYEETCDKLKKQLQFRNACDRFIEDYLRDGTIDTRGYALVNIVEYLKSTSNGHNLIMRNLPYRYELINNMVVSGFLVAYIFSFMLLCYSTPLIFCIVLGLLLTGSSIYKSPCQVRQEDIMKKLVKLCDEQNLEGKEEPKKQISKEKNDQFKRYFTKVTTYIRSCEKKYKFRDEIIFLENLKADYSEKIDVVQSPDAFLKRVKYMNRLLALEERVYSKEERVGFCVGTEVLLSPLELWGRIKFITGDESAFQNDSFIDKIMNVIAFLNSKHFYGEEQEVIKFYRLAVDYVEARIKFKGKRDFEESRSYEKIYSRASDCFNMTMNRLETIYCSDKLNCTLDEMEQYLKSILNSTDNDGSISTIHEDSVEKRIALVPKQIPSNH